MRALLAAVLAVAALAGCGGGERDAAPRPPAADEPTLIDAPDIRPVRDAFNADQGSVRLVLLLSPT